MREDMEYAIATTLRDAWFQMAGGVGASPDEPDVGCHQVAYEILHSEEMHAIRSQLRFMLRSLECGCNDDVNHGQRYDWLGEYLPQHVIDWVLEHRCQD